MDESDKITIGNLIPKGYSFLHTARQENRGGGVGLLYKTLLNPKQVMHEYFSQIKSFEAISVQIKVLSQITHIVILYRPPNSASIELFMDEFGSLLEMYTNKPGSLIIAGDFNFHIDDKSDSAAKSFMSLIESFNLCQHVD